MIRPERNPELEQTLELGVACVLLCQIDGETHIVLTAVPDEDHKESKKRERMIGEDEPAEFTQLKASMLCLPTGACDHKEESPEEAIQREVGEELGFQLDEKKLRKMIIRTFIQQQRDVSEKRNGTHHIQKSALFLIAGYYYTLNDEECQAICENMAKSGRQIVTISQDKLDLLSEHDVRPATLAALRAYAGQDKPKARAIQKVSPPIEAPPKKTERRFDIPADIQADTITATNGRLVGVGHYYVIENGSLKRQEATFKVPENSDKIPEFTYRKPIVGNDPFNPDEGVYEEVTREGYIPLKIVWSAYRGPNHWHKPDNGIFCAKKFGEKWETRYFPQQSVPATMWMAAQQILNEV